MEPWFPWRPVDVSDKFTKRILKQTLLNCSFVDPARLPEPEWSPTQYSVFNKILVAARDRARVWLFQKGRGVLGGLGFANLI